MIREYTSIQKDLNTTYPIMEHNIPVSERRRLGIKCALVASLGLSPNGFCAVWTGEKRYPKRGEWFLSGVIVGAYFARSDLNHEFHIARIVRVRQIITEVIEEIDPVENQE